MPRARANLRAALLSIIGAPCPATGA